VTDTTTDPMPVFTIKASDKLAAAAVEHHGQLCADRGLFSQQAEVDLALQEILDWRDRNPNLVKVPDHKHVPASPAAAPKLIGPLTAEEWCSFAMSDEDDFLQCCGTTSDFRSMLFYLLRSGGGDPLLDGRRFREEWQLMVDHGLPEGPGGVLLQKLRDFYLGAEVPA
jgi:hypothetical protein